MDDSFHRGKFIDYYQAMIQGAIEDLKPANNMNQNQRNTLRKTNNMLIDAERNEIQQERSDFFLSLIKVFSHNNYMNLLYYELPVD